MNLPMELQLPERSLLSQATIEWNEACRQGYVDVPATIEWDEACRQEYAAVPRCEQSVEQSAMAMAEPWLQAAPASKDQIELVIDCEDHREQIVSAMASPE